MRSNFPAAILLPFGGEGQSLFPRQQQGPGLQAAQADDLRVALSAREKLRRSGDALPRTLAAVAHHRQVCHTPQNRLARLIFEFSRKIFCVIVFFRAVFHSLLKAHAVEARNVVRQALEILTPSIPSRMEEGKTLLIHWTKKIIVEEGHSMQQLFHILQLVVRHYKVSFFLLKDFLLSKNLFKSFFAVFCEIIKGKNTFNLNPIVFVIVFYFIWYMSFRVFIKKWF